jgi:Ca-activated chloride channel family protein
VIAALRRVRWILTLAAVVATVPAPVRTIVAASSSSAQTAQPPSPPGQASQPQTPFRAGVDLVSLNVTVTDGSGKYITDLTAADFNVFEDGVKQDVTFFTRTNLPIALAVLMDTSASMDTKLPTAQEAAIGFAKRLRPQDVAEVIDFDSRVVVLQSFTNNAAELEQAIRKTSAGGSTSLYNAVYIALKDLKKVVAKNTEDIRRQAIVVLSDGEDTSSLVSFDDVLALARKTGVNIYTVGVQSRYAALKQDQPGGHRYFSESDYSMKTLARETGAQAFFPAPAELKSVYGAIASELANQYSIGYVPANARLDGRFRRVVVQIVTKPELRSRTRLGYTADTAPTARTIAGAGGTDQR